MNVLWSPLLHSLSWHYALLFESVPDKFLVLSPSIRYA